MKLRKQAVTIGFIIFFVLASIGMGAHPWCSLRRPLPPTQAGTALPCPPHVPLACLGLQGKWQDARPATQEQGARPGCAEPRTHRVGHD